MLTLAVALTVYHDSYKQQPAVEQPAAETRRSDPDALPSNTVKDDAERISSKTAERIISEEKQKDEDAKTKADWEKSHDGRPNSIAMIFLARRLALQQRLADRRRPPLSHQTCRFPRKRARRIARVADDDQRRLLVPRRLRAPRALHVALVVLHRSGPAAAAL